MWSDAARQAAAEARRRKAAAKGVSAMRLDTAKAHWRATRTKLDPKTAMERMREVPSNFDRKLLARHIKSYRAGRPVASSGDKYWDRWYMEGTVTNAAISTQYRNSHRAKSKR